MTAVLLVFQYGQPRIFFAMARDGLLPQWAARARPEDAHPVHRRRSSPASSSRCGRSIGDAGETYDLTNIGTLFAFALVCIGVLVLRYTSRTGRGRSGCRSSGRSRLLGAAACLFIMVGLPRQAWERFGFWLVIGLVLYFVYGYQAQPAATQIARRSGRRPPAELIPLSGASCRTSRTIDGLGSPA